MQAGIREVDLALDAFGANDPETGRRGDQTFQ
jgi:hypothetical protein